MFLLNKNRSVQEILIEEISFLKSQLLSAQEIIKNLTTKPQVKVSSIDEMKPKKFDPKLKRFISKTDEEINQDLEGLKELGIL